MAPVQPGNAYRTLDPGLNLENVLCFKHSRRVARDNTVKYDSQLIQLLPSLERPSYAGARVEVIEQTDGRLQIACQGEIVPSQLAPPRPGLMRLGGNRDGSHRTLQRQLEQGRAADGNHPATKEAQAAVNRGNACPETQTDPASDCVLEGGAVGQIERVLAARHRQGAWHSPGDRCQVRRVSATAA